MSRWIGRWMMAVGLIHVVFGGVVFADALAGIARDGVWNAVDGHAGRPLAFWFVFVGFLAILLGTVVDSLERFRMRLPRLFGWGFFALTTVSIVAMPVGGGWLLLPPSIGALRRSPLPDTGEAAT